jgi:hypothetical protein
MVDEVIRPNFGDPKLKIDRSSGKRCSHEYVTLRFTDKRVICRTCNREVDAFDVLKNLAISWEWCTYHGAQLDEQVDKLEELKREEANVKSRLRSAHKLAVPEGRSVVYFDELLRRLNEAESAGAIREAHRWSADFKWLDPLQYEILKGAQLRAERRSEDARRKSNRRNKTIRVLAGGKSG